MDAPVLAEPEPGYAPGFLVIEAKPMAVLQDAISAESTISIADFPATGIVNFEEDIVSGKIQPQDIRNTLAVLEGALQAFDKKVTETKGQRAGVSTAYADVSEYWREQRARTRSIRRLIESRRNSPTLIKGSETQTIGAIIREGMDKYSLGSKMMELESMFPDDQDAQLAELMRPFDVYAEIDESGRSPYMKEQVRRINEIRSKQSPLD